MSRAHEVIGNAAMFFEQGGKWGQGPANYRPGTYCAGQVIDQFGNAAKFNGQEWLDVLRLFMREVGVGVVEFNDSPSTDRKKLIETLHRISQSAELE